MNAILQRFDTYVAKQIANYYYNAPTRTELRRAYHAHTQAAAKIRNLRNIADRHRMTLIELIPNRDLRYVRCTLLDVSPEKLEMTQDIVLASYAKIGLYDKNPMRLIKTRFCSTCKKYKLHKEFLHIIYGIYNVKISDGRGGILCIACKQI